MAKRRGAGARGRFDKKVYVKRGLRSSLSKSPPNREKKSRILKKK